MGGVTGGVTGRSVISANALDDRVGSTKIRVARERRILLLELTIMM